MGFGANEDEYADIDDGDADCNDDDDGDGGNDDDGGGDDMICHRIFTTYDVRHGTPFPLCITEFCDTIRHFHVSLIARGTTKFPLSTCDF